MKRWSNSCHHLSPPLQPTECGGISMRVFTLRLRCVLPRLGRTCKEASWFNWGADGQSNKDWKRVAALTHDSTPTDSEGLKTKVNFGSIWHSLTWKLAKMAQQQACMTMFPWARMVICKTLNKMSQDLRRLTSDPKPPSPKANHASCQVWCNTKLANIGCRFIEFTVGSRIQFHEFMYPLFIILIIHVSQFGIWFGIPKLIYMIQINMRVCQDSGTLAAVLVGEVEFAWFSWQPIIQISCLQLKGKVCCVALARKRRAKSGCLTSLGWNKNQYTNFNVADAISTSTSTSKFTPSTMTSRP